MLSQHQQRPGVRRCHKLISIGPAADVSVEKEDQKRDLANAKTVRCGRCNRCALSRAAGTEGGADIRPHELRGPAAEAVIE